MGHRYFSILLALLAIAGCGSDGSSSTRPRDIAAGRVPGTTLTAGADQASTPGGATAPPSRLPGHQAAAAARLARIGLPVYCGAAHGREVALTFDDGPGDYTAPTLRLLRAAGVTATFFLIGRNVTRRPMLASADARLGEVGDHTLTHPLLTALTPPAIATELTAGLADAKRAVGRPVLFFRPPYGAINPAVRSAARRLSLPTILWNVDSRDSRGAGTAEVVHNAEAGLKPGAIILMHENTKGTRNGLRLILRAVHRRRLRAVTVAQLLADDPPSIGQLRAGYRGCGAG